MTFFWVCTNKKCKYVFELGSIPPDQDSCKCPKCKGTMFLGAYQ